MSTAVSKKPRANAEAVAQISALPERVSVLETKVENISEKLVDLKADVKDTMYAMAALAFAAGTGWLNAASFPHILKFLGL